MNKADHKNSTDEAKNRDSRCIIGDYEAIESSRQAARARLPDILSMQ